MAVVQISKIELRNGIKTDLPNSLAKAEIGFSVDSGELFIGADITALPPANRAAFPFKNVQILTEFSKNVEDLVSYSAQMRDFGALDVFNKPTPRLNPEVAGVQNFSIKLQERLDERVSVLEYGATGFGVDSDAVNISIPAAKAADEAYFINRASLDAGRSLVSSTTQDRYHPKSIHFPSGVYVVNRQLVLPPLGSWVGDGIGNTIIFLNDATVESLLTTVSGAATIADLPPSTSTSSAGTISAHSYANITSAAGLPHDIIVTGIEFRRTGNLDIVHLIRGKNILFNQCKFRGGFQPAGEPIGYTYNSSGTAGTVVDSSAIIADSLSGVDKNENIYFLNCEFDQTTYAMLATDDVNNIRFINCKYSCHLRAISLSEPLPVVNSHGRLTAGAIGPRGVTSIGGKFDRIAQEGFIVWDNMTQATATAALAGSGIGSISVVSGGSGYSTAPAVVITNSGPGPSVVAKATANIAAGSVTSITVTINGSGYTNPVVLIDPPAAMPAFTDDFDKRPGQHASIANIYDKVGDGLDANCNSLLTPLTNVVHFGTGAYYNISALDRFSRNNINFPSRVYSSDTGKNIILNPQDPVELSLGISKPGVYEIIKDRSIFPAGGPTNGTPRILIPLLQAENITVRYSLVDTVSSISRSGSFDVISNGTVISFNDSLLNLTGVLAVTLSAVNVNIAGVSYIELRANNTTGNVVSIIYSIIGWLNS